MKNPGDRRFKELYLFSLSKKVKRWLDLCAWVLTCGKDVEKIVGDF